MAIELIK